MSWCLECRRVPFRSHGTNDVPVIGGTSTGSVSEDVALDLGNLATSGTLTIADADQGQSSFTAQAGSAGTNGYGTFTLDAAGHWTYTADQNSTPLNPSHHITSYAAF